MLTLRCSALKHVVTMAFHIFNGKDGLKESINRSGPLLIKSSYCYLLLSILTLDARTNHQLDSTFLSSTAMSLLLDGSAWLIIQLLSASSSDSSMITSESLSRVPPTCMSSSSSISSTDA